MSGMFDGARAFNQPLGAAFDTSNVTDAFGMFAGARASDQPLGAAFDTSDVTDMSGMFDGAHATRAPCDAARVIKMSTRRYVRESGRAKAKRETEARLGSRARARPTA